MTTSRIVTSVAGVIIVSTIGLIATGRPILFRIVDPTEVTRNPVLVVVNPLRDRAPEVTAESVLSDLRARKLEKAFDQMGNSANESIRQSETKYPVQQWRLINRHDHHDMVILTYMVSRNTAPPVKTIVRIGVVRDDGDWIVSSFGPIY